MTNDDGDVIIEEQQLPENHPDHPDTVAVPQTCGTTLNFQDHGDYVQHPRGEDANGTRLEERFQQAALRFTCPDCGSDTWMCPVCSDEDENTPPGWFRGESSGEQIACHNCNAQEAARQDRGY